ncbi:MAG: peroxiredoxin [Cyclobacteriaceae bacterium]
MLKIGDQIPDVELVDQDGENISLRASVGRKAMVIYFYPKNNTPGCTLEACSFRDSYEEFVELGADVIGISGDSTSSHKQVVEKRRLPFILLSDNQKIAEKAFGVKRSVLGLLPGRVTFIIDKKGFVIDIFSSTTQPTKHVSTALEALKAADK